MECEMDTYQLVEVKREWVPEWLFSALFWPGRRWMLRQPFRWMLFKKVR
jgi:hypothetical protein